MEPSTEQSTSARASASEALTRIPNVLLKPTETFESIRRAPSWGIVMMVFIALGLVIGFLVESRIDQASFRTFLEDRGLPDAEVEKALDRQFNPTPTIRYLQTAGKIGGPILWFVVASAFFFAGARLSGSQMSFKGSLGTTLHGLIPLNGVAALVSIPVILARSSIPFRETFSGSFLASHLGVLASEESSAVVRALLSSVDLFSIWSIVLLVIGFSTVGRISRKAAAVVVLVPWLLAVACKVGFAALLGGAMGGG